MTESFAIAPSDTAVRKPVITLFDLDHTLLPLDSDYSFGQFLTEQGWTDKAEFAARNAQFYQDYKARRLDLHAYIDFATRAIKTHGQAAASAMHDQYMQQVIAPAMRPTALQLVKQAVAQSAHVALVTASNEFLTAPIAKAFGIEHLIAVQLERGDAAKGEPWITGRIAGVPSYQAGKVTRVQAWLASLGYGWDDVHIVFYSDSMNDLPLLERSNHPIATNPDPQLRQLAAQRGWAVMDLFQHD